MSRTRFGVSAFNYKCFKGEVHTKLKCYPFDIHHHAGSDDILYMRITVLGFHGKNSIASMVAKVGGWEVDGGEEKHNKSE